MLTLITGGSASGKSEYAEQLIAASHCEPRIYIATMQPFDAECEARIAKHRCARAGRGFATIERYTNLAGMSIPQGSAVLLECMSNLVANELYSESGARENAVQEILRGVELLCESAHDVVVVSNEIFSDGVQYDPETAYYIDTLGEINRQLAQRADRVVEVVYTIPVYHKGERT
ncbi:bifunctional adenosylcobinamide kinase/adenosylcobinamide-phosphate guanylyltransferase [Oscillospiraceae bacterium PP1C4]